MSCKVTKGWRRICLCIGNVFICSISSTQLLGTRQVFPAGQAASAFCASQNAAPLVCSVGTTAYLVPGWAISSKKGFLFYPHIAPNLYLKSEKYALKKKKKGNINSDSWNYLCICSFSSQFKFPCRIYLCCITVNTANWCNFNTA